MPPPQPPRPIDTIPTQLPIDALSSNKFPFLHPAENVKFPDEDVSRNNAIFREGTKK
jgi:hypothetical protein